MSIPTLPAFFDMYFTTQDGRLAPDGYLYNDQMFQALNIAVFLLNDIVQSIVLNDGTVNNGTVINQGVRIPNKTTVEITTLEPDVGIGTVWFNTNLAKLQVKTAAGIIETITSV